MTVLDSSEKVLMSRGLAEDRGDWVSPVPDSTMFCWKGEAEDTSDISTLTQTLCLSPTHTHTYTHKQSDTCKHRERTIQVHTKTWGTWIISVGLTAVYYFMKTRENSPSNQN